jgi:hypothetical protein
MDESTTPQATTIDLNAPENLIEYKLSLTVGQIKLLRMLVDRNLQPKGYEMLKLTLDLYERLQVPEVTAEEAFE